MPGTGIQCPKKPTRQLHFIKRNKYKKSNERKPGRTLTLFTICAINPWQRTWLASYELCYNTKTEVRADLARYQRTVRWTHSHHSNPGNDNSESENEEESGPANLFRPRKTNLPSAPPPQTLDRYLKAVESEILGSIDKTVKPNISPEELEAVQQLREHQDEGLIWLAEVDKGGGVAIMRNGMRPPETSAHRRGWHSSSIFM